MNENNEPVYPITQSVLNAAIDFLADDSTTGKINRGALVLSALQGIGRAGPMSRNASNGKDADPEAQAQAAALAEAKRIADAATGEATE